MPKPTLSDVLNVHDPMLNDNYDLVFAKVPGNGGADNRQLTIQCKTANKPGTTMAEVEVELFGHKVMHGARRTWSNTLTIEFVEDANGKITHAIEAWVEWIRETQTQHGHFKKDYASDAVLHIYDQEGNTTMTYNIYNCWPSEVPDLQFDGSGGQALTLSCTFKFDYLEEEGGGGG